MRDEAKYVMIYIMQQGKSGYEAVVPIDVEKLAKESPKVASKLLVYGGYNGPIADLTYRYIRDDRDIDEASVKRISRPTIQELFTEILPARVSRIPAGRNAINVALKYKPVE